MAWAGDDPPAEELQQSPPVTADLLAPGVSPSSAGEERPPAQLLLEDGPESRLGTQHLDATHTRVDAALRESATLSSSGPRCPVPPSPRPGPRSPTCWHRFTRIWMTGQKRVMFSSRITLLSEGRTVTCRQTASPQHPRQ